MVFYFAYATLFLFLYHLGSNNIYYALTAPVNFLFIWGSYNPYTYQVTMFVFAYFLFYKKFKWLSPFMFMFVWGFNDVFYNVTFDMAHLSALLAGQIPAQMPNGVTVYIEKVMIEALIMIIGATFLHLRFNMSYTFAKYFGLTLIIGGIIWAAIMGFPIGEIGAVGVYQAFMGITGLLTFMYTAVVSRAEKPMTVPVEKTEAKRVVDS